MSNYYKKLKKQKNKLKFLLSRVLWLTRISSIHIIDRDFYKIRFYPSSISAKLFVDKSIPMEEKFIANILKHKDTVIDIGANIGTFTLLSSYCVGPMGQVYSFEANKRTYGFLNGNVRLNNFSNVKTFNLAVGDQNKQVLISNKRADDMNHLEDNTGSLIKMIKLDDFIKNSLKVVDLLKVDVEGFEKQVLNGSENLLYITKKVFIEISKNNYQRYNNEIKEVIEILKKSGFSLYQIVNEVTIKKFDYKNLIYKKDSFFNLIGIKDENLNQINIKK